MTMKKVNDIPDFLSKMTNQKPAEPLLNSIQSLAATEENFMKKLLEASLALQDSEMSVGDTSGGGGGGEVTRDNSGDRFPPVILVTGPPAPPVVAEFRPSKADDDLQFLPISNPEISGKTKAIFPQNQKEDDETVFITQKPQVDELNNLGFHQIQSPSLGQKSEVQAHKAHLVRSQLVVGNQMSQTPEPNIFPVERQKAEKELEQLEELGKTLGSDQT